MHAAVSLNIINIVHVLSICNEFLPCNVKAVFFICYLFHIFYDLGAFAKILCRGYYY